MLYRPATEFKVPMLFVYGEGDAAGKQNAEKCEKDLVGKFKKNFPLTMAYKVAAPNSSPAKNC